MPSDSLPLTPDDSYVNKAVFLDRDGTINVEKEYLINPEEFEFIPGAVAALRKLHQAGYLLVIVTNQAGVARGYFSCEQVEALHSHMLTLLGDDIPIAGIYYCPHHPTCGHGEYLLECDCRKGKPGMLLRAADELNIDISSSYMVGDKLADLQAGIAAGCKPCLVRTGYGQEVEKQMDRGMAVVVDDLHAAADLIVASS